MAFSTRQSHSANEQHLNTHKQHNNSNTESHQTGEQFQQNKKAHNNSNKGASLDWCESCIGHQLGCTIHDALALAHHKSRLQKGVRVRHQREGSMCQLCKPTFGVKSDALRNLHKTSLKAAAHRACGTAALLRSSALVCPYADGPKSGWSAAKVSNQRQRVCVCVCVCVCVFAHYQTESPKGT